MLTVEQHLELENQAFDFKSKSVKGHRILRSYPVGLGVSVSIQNSEDHYCREGQVEIYTGNNSFLEDRLSEYCDGYGIAAFVPIEVAEEAMRDYAKFIAKQLLQE